MTAAEIDGNVIFNEYDAAVRRARVMLTVNGHIVVHQAYTYAIADAFTYDNLWTSDLTKTRKSNCGFVAISRRHS